MKQRFFRSAVIWGLVCLLCIGCWAGIHTAMGTISHRRLREDMLSGHLYENRSMGDGHTAAVILAGLTPGENRALATELCRRGYTVLRPADSAQILAAVHWLQSQPNIRPHRIALVLGNELPPAAADCAGELAATVFLTTGAEWINGDFPNALAFSAGAPTVQQLSAFLRCDDRQGEIGRIFGYFVEGTARCVELTGSTPTYRDKRVQTRLFDWLGSAIGHQIEIPDARQHWAVADGFAAAGIVTGAAALALFLIHRVKARKFRNQEDPQP
jgi:hypothetical protein